MALRLVVTVTESLSVASADVISSVLCKSPVAAWAQSKNATDFELAVHDKAGRLDFRLVFGDFDAEPDHVLNLRDPVEVVMTHSCWADSPQFDQMSRAKDA